MIIPHLSPEQEIQQCHWKSELKQYIDLGVTDGEVPLLYLLLLDLVPINILHLASKLKKFGGGISRGLEKNRL